MVRSVVRTGGRSGCGRRRGGSRLGKGQASDRKSVSVGSQYVTRELCGPVGFSSCKIAGWTIHRAGAVILRMHSRRPQSVMQTRSAPQMGFALSREERAPFHNAWTVTGAFTSPSSDGAGGGRGQLHGEEGSDRPTEPSNPSFGSPALRDRHPPPQGGRGPVEPGQNISAIQQFRIPSF